MAGTLKNVHESNLLKEIKIVNYKDSLKIM